MPIVANTKSHPTGIRYVEYFKTLTFSYGMRLVRGVSSTNISKWGIHFTQVTPIFCGLGSRDFGVPIGNDRAIRGWVNGHSLLHQPVEELAAAA